MLRMSDLTQYNHPNEITPPLNLIDSLSNHPETPPGRQVSADSGNSRHRVEIPLLGTDH